MTSKEKKIVFGFTIKNSNGRIRFDLYYIIIVFVRNCLIGLFFLRNSVSRLRMQNNIRKKIVKNHKAIKVYKKKKKKENWQRLICVYVVIRSLAGDLRVKER